MTQSRADYLSGLLRAYEDERSAAEAFAILLDQPGFSAEQRDIIGALARIERAMAALLKPVVARHNLSAASDEQVRIEGALLAKQIRDWSALTVLLGPELEVYVTRFEALVAAADPRDRPALELLVDHEHALARFSVNPDETIRDILAITAKAERIIAI